MIDTFQNIWFEFFCKPVVEHTGYNLVNTLVYVAILLIAAFYVVYPMLSKKGIKFDLKFMLALMPYVILGSTFRVLEDMHLLPRSCNPLELGFYTYTPGIYIFTFAITILMLVLSWKISKRNNGDFYKLFGSIGVILMAPIVAFLLLNFRAWPGFFAVIIGVVAITGIMYFIMTKFRKDFFKDRINLLAVSSQLLDGTATVIATEGIPFTDIIYRCGEQHVLSEAVLGVHPFAFVILKLILILLILHYVDKEIKDENMRGFIKVFLIILGFATGTRDLFTLGVGSCL
ncbi:MAG: DUF63 family protein [Candidatus Diapherotrites archaeon]